MDDDALEVCRFVNFNTCRVAVHRLVDNTIIIMDNFNFVSIARIISIRLDNMRKISAASTI